MSLEERTMTYEDPRSGKERNLGQDDVGSSWSWLGGAVIIAALAYGGWYFYNHSQTTADLNKPAATPTADNSSSVPNSGPGVQGAPGSTNGPAPESSSTGSSTGTSGTASGNEPATQPSQDATGVQGAPGSTNGPAEGSPKQ
jgi:hypothetical protein